MGRLLSRVGVQDPFAPCRLAADSGAAEWDVRLPPSEGGPWRPQAGD